MRSVVYRIIIVLFFLSLFTAKLNALKENLSDLSWRFVTGGKILYKPAVDHRGIIYFASDDRHLYAVLPEGREKWSFALRSKPSSSPVISYSGTIYIGCVSGKFYAVAPNGSLRWCFDSGSGACLNPALGRDGTIYLPTSGGTLYALDFAGNEKWRFKARAGISSSASIGPGGSIYFSSTDRRLYALNPSGEKKWEARMSGSVGTPAVGLDGNLYVNSSGIQAISPNGKHLWHYSIPARTADPVIQSDGIIIAGAQNARLYAISSRGKKIWDLYIGEAMQSPAAVAEDNSIFVGTENNHLYVVTPDGRVQWVFSAKRTVRIPTITEDGSLYFGSDDWILYALKLKAGGPDDGPWPIYLHDTQHTSRFNGLKDLCSPAAMILKELAYSNSIDLKFAALSDIEQYIEGRKFLAVHVQSLEEILAFLALEGVTYRVYEQGTVINNYPQVRLRSCEILGSLATEGAWNILLDVIHNDSDSMVKTTAVGALARIGADVNGRAVKTILFELEKSSAGQQQFIFAALTALERIAEKEGFRDPSLIPHLVRITQGNYSKRIREQALRVLHALAPGKELEK